MTEKFELVKNDGIVDLLSQVKDKSVPVLKKEVDFDGLGLIAMERGWAYIELKPKEFNEYLKHEGITDIKVKLEGGVQKERYRRYIKSLVLSGDKIEGEIYKKVIGQRLEIVLLKNPYLLKVGDELEVQVLFEGKPLANKIVTLYGAGQNDVFEQKAKTNKNGIAKFKVKNSGFQLVRLVHLRRCENCDNVNWESFGDRLALRSRRDNYLTFIFFAGSVFGFSSRSLSAIAIPASITDLIVSKISLFT